MKYRFPKYGELTVYGYNRDLTEYVTEKQLLDENLWKLFVNQYRTHSDKNGDWRGEYWGKTMRGGCLIYESYKSERLYNVLAATVKEMLSVQEKNGRLSTYPIEIEFNGWDMWCRKYVMLGMLYFLPICKSKDLERRIIVSLKKQADYIIDHIGAEEGKKSILDTCKLYGAMNSCSILEAFVKLYGVTNEKRYLDFAAYIVGCGFSKNLNLIDECLNGQTPPYMFPDVKAYEMMSCFEGLNEYYKYVKYDKYLKAIENFVDMLVKTDYTIIGCCGCSGELLDNSSVTQTNYSDDIMQETCVTVTFIKLCAKLYLTTGNAKYLDYIEQSSYNAMYGSVNDTEQTMKKTEGDVWEGDNCYQVNHEAFPFDSYSPLVYNRRGKKVGGFMVMEDGRSYGCCACIGSAGIAVANLAAISIGDGGFSVNLYISLAFKTVYNGKEIKITVNANVYSKNKAIIKVCGNNERFKLKLRIPRWMENPKITVDGKETDTIVADAYISLDREWEKSVIELKYSAPIRERVLNGKVAFTKGPVVLARDIRLDDIQKPLNIKAKDGKALRAKLVKNQVFKSNATYKIHAGDNDILVCDYASAGKNYDSDSSCITVWENIRRWKI